MPSSPNPEGASVMAQETNELSPIPGPMPYTDEWYAIRNFDPNKPVVFGASEAAAAMNKSPYSSPLELYLQKRQEVAPKETTEAMEIGTLLEPVILELYSRREGVELETNLPMYFHPVHKFMAATPDAIEAPWIPSAPSGGAVDAKSTTDHRYSKDPHSLDKFGEEGTDQIPIDNLCQMQQQIAVLGVEYVKVPVLFGRKMRVYTVDKNDTLIDAIISSEKELAERIVNADPPEPNWQHPNTKKILREIYGLSQDARANLSDDAAVRWNENVAMKAEIANLESKIEENVNRLLAEMQDAEYGVFPMASKELRRVKIDAQLWSQKDIDKATKLMGTVKRRGYEYLRSRAAK